MVKMAFKGEFSTSWKFLSSVFAKNVKVAGIVNLKLVFTDFFFFFL